jgi:hypothetical protein
MQFVRLSHESHERFLQLDCLSHGQGTPAATFCIAVIATDASRLPAMGSIDMGMAG